MVSQPNILNVGNQITNSYFINTLFKFISKFSGKTGDIVLGYDSVKSYKVRIKSENNIFHVFKFL